MKDGLNIVQRTVGDKGIDISFIPTRDCSGKEIRIVAIPIEDETELYVLAYDQGGPKGKKITTPAYYGIIPSGKYSLYVYDEDDNEVAKGGLIMFNSDGFTVSAFDAGTPDYLEDGNAEVIVDHNGYNIIVAV